MKHFSEALNTVSWRNDIAMLMLLQFDLNLLEKLQKPVINDSKQLSAPRFALGQVEPCVNCETSKKRTLLWFVLSSLLHKQRSNR